MTEEVKVVEQTQETQQEPAYTPTEQRAIEDGWKPKEVFVADGGDEADWRPAKEFNDRGELFRKIEEGKKEIRSLKRTMSAFKQHYDKVREVEFNRALDTLKKAKTEALEEGNAAKVVEIDEEISETKVKAHEAKQLSQQAEPNQEIHPELQAWVDKNRWYENNNEMREFADSIGIAYKKTHGAAEPADVLKYVEKRVTQAFPEQFKNPRRAAVSAVESPVPARKSSASVDLTDDQTRVMQRLVRQGVLTEEQYKKDLKALNEKKGNK